MWCLKDKKRLFVSILVLIVCARLKGQQFTQFSSYLINSMGINAAYTGSKDATEFLANYRKQWITLPGSPQTISLNGNGFFKERNIGLGGALLSDKIGGTKTTNIAFNGSYRIKVGAYKLQFGLNAGSLFYKQQLNDLDIVDAGDKVLTGSELTVISPILGSGIYFFNDDLYLGLSSPDLLESSLINKKRHYYFSLGKVFNITSTLKIKPALLAKYVQSSMLQLDLSTTLIFKDYFGVGASLRTGAGFVVSGQVYPTDYLTIAMAYDKMTNGLFLSEIGTIELTALYTLFSNRAIIYNPRYF